MQHERSYMIWWHPKERMKATWPHRGEAWCLRLCESSLTVCFKEQLGHAKCLSLFYFLTSWMTSSSSITWSLPTFWGLCFTEEPHTSALERRIDEKSGYIPLKSWFMNCVSLVHYIREVLLCCWNSTSLQKGKFRQVIHKALIEDLIMAFPASFIFLFFILSHTQCKG